MKLLVLSLIVFSASTFAAPPTLTDRPNSAITPGVINPNVTQANINDTICKVGWTKTIRPPVRYTNKIKIQQIAAMNLPGDKRDYEQDHLISLQLGGHPTDPKNLWPEPWVSRSGWNARKKDVLETYMKRQVCAGQITLADAQHDIATDWVLAYKKYTPTHKQK